MNEKLNEANFLIYAMHHYDNTQCYSLAEFEDDLKKFLYLKKLISRYKNNGDLKERLILNHLILLNNVFGPEPTARILFYRIDERDYDILKTFLVYLNIMPDIVSGIRGKTIHSEDILVEPNILEILLRI